MIEKRPDGLYLEAPQRLRGTQDPAAVPDVGATEQVLLTAVLAEGVTELSNAAIEPEIVDLICVLQKMGAIISMDTDRIDPHHRRRPARRLHPPRPPGPAGGRLVGVRGAGDRGRHLRARRHAARDDDVPEHLPHGRRRLRDRRRAALDPLLALRAAS